MIEQMKQALLKLKGVNAVYVKTNNSFESIGNYPPVSFTLFIDGGIAQEIAEVIELYRCIGVASNGDFPIGTEYGEASWVRLHKGSVKRESEEYARVSLRKEKEALIKRLVEIEGQLCQKNKY